MRPDQSPFPAAWWGTDLENVGLAKARPRVGTYGRYSFRNLPTLPLNLNGSFDWLEDLPVNKHHIGVERENENVVALLRLLHACEEAGVQLPKLFIRFFERSELHQRIRSTTDCYLDLVDVPHMLPTGDALVRFLCDSQYCAFWYIHIPRGSRDHAVVGGTDLFGTSAEMADWDLPLSNDLSFVERSFEAFMCRYWIEQETWYAAFEGRPLDPLAQVYVNEYARLAG